MAARDPELRRLLAQAASNARHARLPKPAPRHVPEELRARYEREVDPATVLDADDRRKRALSAWKRDLALAAADERRAQLAALTGSGALQHVNTHVDER